MRTAFDRALVGALTIAAIVTPAHAAHPLLTEDTGTQGAGRFELELGTALAREGGTRALELGPQLSYGAQETLDLIVRPTWLRVRGDATDGTTQGFGDVGLDFKWRFLEDDALSCGVRAGVNLPTGNGDNALGSGKASPHAILIATWAAEPLTFSANAAWAYDPLVGDRRNLWAASAAGVWSASEAWRLSVEIGTAANPDASKSSWLTVARFGAIASLARWLDVDVGYQVRLARAAPVQVILAGATLRW